MTTIATRRTDLATALTAQGVTLRDTWAGEPPYALLFWNGSDLAPSVNGQVPAQFRLVMIVSKALDNVSLAAADTIIASAMTALLGLTGWRIDSIGALRRSDVGQDRMYTVDIVTTALVTFS